MLFYFYRRMALSENYMTGEIFFLIIFSGWPQRYGGSHRSGRWLPPYMYNGHDVSFLPNKLSQEGLHITLTVKPQRIVLASRYRPVVLP